MQMKRLSNLLWKWLLKWSKNQNIICNISYCDERWRDCVGSLADRSNVVPCSIKNWADVIPIYHIDGEDKRAALSLLRGFLSDSYLWLEE